MRQPSQHTLDPRTINADEESENEADSTPTGSFHKVTPSSGRSGLDHSSHQATWSRILIRLCVCVLCAIVGFAAIAQHKNIQSSYASLSENELVRLLDETNQQMSLLESQRSQLTQQLDSIQSAADQRAQLEKVEKENEMTQGILAGTLPATGPGVQITIRQGSEHIDAGTLFNLIEELRNAGAEVIQVNNVRVVTSTYFANTSDGVDCDGSHLTSPYVFQAIGDQDALSNSVNIAGGVGSRLRVQYGASVSIEKKDSIQITRIRQPKKFTYAQTVE